MDDPLIIATRESPLALAQANFVKAQLEALDDGLDVELLGMTTRGDQILDKPLAKIGGKGLFIKELELAMQEGSADLAVHSLKDVPMVLPKGFVLAAILKREDPRDAFVSNKYASLDAMPAGGVVGTSSLRRAAVLKRKYPGLKFEPLRGNVNTRLRKLDAGEYDAAILAAAGLIRLGMADRIRARIDIAVSIPAPGQAALGIEVLADDEETAEIVAELDHAPTAICCTAERTVSRLLGGSCELPLGAYADWVEGEKPLRLRAFVANLDGSQYVEAEAFGTPDMPEALGEEVAEILKAKGALEIIKSLG
ncbi:MAG: hydroxymethylbilane synthase [Burkholderiales bacterium]|nr:MAG: hydroxymethylbilane synthase [Betaproteobacteria bacterium]TAG84464.1 MAG: hydroxymethylbilane synthase [Burkholderiales bacterium]